MGQETEERLTVAEAAEALDVRVATVYRWRLAQKNGNPRQGSPRVREDDKGRLFLSRVDVEAAQNTVWRRRRTA